VSRYQKGKTKTNPDFLEQETVSGSGISWAICKSAPCPRQITTPARSAPHYSVFFTDRMLFLPPNQQRHNVDNKMKLSSSLNLSHVACLPCGPCVLLFFFIFVLFLVVNFSPRNLRIYWTYFHQIFTKMVGTGLRPRLLIFLFPVAQGTLPWQPILGAKSEKSAYSPSFVALAFRNGLEYRIQRQ